MVEVSAPTDGLRSGASVWHWMKSDPKNAAAVFTTAFVLVEAVNELRWYRENGYRSLSLRGSIAYLKARPTRFAIGVVVAWAPDVVAFVLSARRDQRRVHPDR